MYKNSLGFLFCASIAGALYCQGSQKVEGRYYGKFPEQLERNLTRKPGEFVQVRTARVYLLDGQPGNGLRMTARLYAERMGAEWREVPFTVLLDGYKKFGAAHIHDFFQRMQEEAKGKKIVLYIPNLDGNITVAKDIEYSDILDMNILLPIKLPIKLHEQSQQKLQRERQLAEIKPVLDLVRIELEKIEDKQSDEGGVFVVFSSRDFRDIDISFLRYLEFNPIEIESDAKTKLRIFHAHLFAQDDVRTLLEAYKAARGKLPKESKALEIAVRIDELEALLLAHEELVTCFWEQKIKNEACWRNQTEYIKTKEAIVQLYTEVQDKAYKASKFSLTALKESAGLSSAEKLSFDVLKEGTGLSSIEIEFYLAAKDLACELMFSGLCAKQLYNSEEWTTFLVKTTQNPKGSNRVFEIVAKDIRVKVKVEKEY